jgi:mono/diheme cytochrome c family protein
MLAVLDRIDLRPHRTASSGVTALMAATMGLLLVIRAIDAWAYEESSIPNLGREMFIERCAPCHGADGHGARPAAAALNPAPPDLTQLSRRHDGTFPYFYVVDVIDGERGALRHGSREMPIWGREFRWQTGEYGARAYIYTLTQYLQSIQQQ